MSAEWEASMAKGRAIVAAEVDKSREVDKAFAAYLASKLNAPTVPDAFAAAFMAGKAAANAARALYSACCNYGSRREQDIRDAVKSYELAALSATQPTADERVAEHMRCVDDFARASTGQFAQSAKAMREAIEAFVRALLSASQEDAKQQARLVELVLCMGASRKRQDWADLHIDLSEAISIAEALKGRK